MADSLALTLPQYATMSNHPLITSVIASLLQHCVVLNDIPIKTDPTLVQTYGRYRGSDLPTPTFRKLNEDPTTVSAQLEHRTEQAYILSNKIVVDRLLLMDKNRIMDPRAMQLEMYLQGFGYLMNDIFINNDHLTGDEDAQVGIRWRLDNPTQSGLVSECKIDGGAIDMRLSALTKATVIQFLELIDRLLDFLGSPSGDGVVLYMDETMRRIFNGAVKTLEAGQGFSIVQDAFGRQVEMYRGAIIRTMGRKADQVTKIITTTETTTGSPSGGNATSIYGVKYGENHFHAWQMAPLIPMDIGMIGNAGNLLSTLMEHAMGFLCPHERSLGRIFNVRVQ